LWRAQVHDAREIKAAGVVHRLCLEKCQSGEHGNADAHHAARLSYEFGESHYYFSANSAHGPLAGPRWASVAACHAVSETTLPGGRRTGR